MYPCSRLPSSTLVLLSACRFGTLGRCTLEHFCPPVLLSVCTSACAPTPRGRSPRPPEAVARSRPRRGLGPPRLGKRRAVRAVSSRMGYLRPPRTRLWEGEPSPAFFGAESRQSYPKCRSSHEAVAWSFSLHMRNFSMKNCFVLLQCLTKVCFIWGGRERPRESAPGCSRCA